MRLSMDKRIPFDASVDEVWAAMSDVGSYQRWWPWLEEFQADTLAVGETWRCDVKAPLRYHVRFTLKFIVVVPATHIECSLRGDIGGGAWIDVEEQGDKCDIWIRSEIYPESTFLKSLTRLLYPVALAGHDAVIANGARQFQQRALTPGASDTTR